MNKKVQTILISLICALTLFFNSTIIKAASLNPHAYAIQRIYNGTFAGGYFYIPTFNVWSNWSVSNYMSFITNEMWVSNDNYSNQQWIEAGIVDGNLNGSYWRGRYWAYQDSNGYHEYSIGSNQTLSAASFDIENANTNYKSWDIYVSGTRAATVTMPWSTATRIDNGIESSNSGNGFNQSSIDQDMEFSYPGNSWYFWNARAVYNADNNTLNWYTSYDSTNNITTFHY